MLTSLSESVIDMLCSRPPSLQVLVVGLCRGKELHPKENACRGGWSIFGRSGRFGAGNFGY